MPEPTPTLPAPRVPDPASAPALRWGIISTGGIANQFADTIARATASRVVAVCSRTRERAEEFTARHGGAAHEDVRAMLETEDLDAVYVASPHAQHHAYARAVIEAGVPALVEKAFTLDLAQAQDLVDLARERGVFLMEAMWARFLPQTDVLRQVIQDGMLGELVLVRADHGQHFPLDPRHRLYAPELGGGALLDLGVYPISFAQMVLGNLEALEIAGDLAPTGVDATLALLAAGEHGGRAALTSTLRARTVNEAQVAGTDGIARLSSPFYAPGTLTVDLGERGTATYRHPGDPDLGLAYEAAEAARRITAGELESPLMPWGDTLSVMATMDAVRDALGVAFPALQEER